MTRPMNFAIHYVGDGYSTEARLMGRQAAGKALMKGVADTWTTGLVFGHGPGGGKAMADHLLADGFQGRLVWRTTLAPIPPHWPEVLYHPGPPLLELAHDRNLRGAAAGCLMGVTHTLSSQRAMDSIADMAAAPFQSWDALICTSQAALTVVRTLLADREAWLAEHLGARKFARVQLPLIPLGVDAPAHARTPDQIAWARAGLGVADDEVAFLFAGRLSFHAKANPAPFYLAAEQAARTTGRRIVCLEAGQFPNASVAEHFRQAQATLAPSVRFKWVDGADADLYRQAWRGADVFVSLSDNIQETFGLTPLEAMAAGLPVLVSDWDGYKDTVRDGVDGFRIPTLGPPSGTGEDLASRFAQGLDSYDRYIGQYSMCVSVDVDRLTDRLVQLVQNGDLRTGLGASGQARATQEYDWPVILGRYADLAAELDALRAAATPGPALAWPGRKDPSRLFAQFPTAAMGANWGITGLPGRESALLQLLDLGVANYVVDEQRMSASLIQDLYRLAARGPQTVGDLIRDSGGGSRHKLRALMWLAKLGLVTLVPPAGV